MTRFVSINLTIVELSSLIASLHMICQCRGQISINEEALYAT